MQSRKIAGNVFIDFESQRFSNSHSSSAQKDEKHLLSSFGTACNRIHHRVRERWLPLILNFRQIDEFMVPRSRVDAFSVLVDRRRHDHLDDLNYVEDCFWRQACIRHLRHQISHSKIVDRRNRQRTQIRFEPSFQIAPKSSCSCRLNRFSLASLYVIQPPLSLLVKVNRPAVEVRSRSGYYAVAEPVSATQRDAEKLSNAVGSPLESTDLGFDVQAEATELAGGRHLRVKITLDAGDLRFAQQGDRWTDKLFEVWAEFDDQGQQVGKNAKTIGLSPSQDAHKQLLRDGLTFSETVPIADGATQIRLVLRDGGNGAIGSVIIPLAKLFTPNSAPTAEKK
jgi:hypothetical protein